MIIIKSIEWSGGACPYQIEATTEDGQHFYLRYRGGRLRASCHSNSADQCKNYNVIDVQIGGTFDGAIDHDEAIELLKDKVKFPEGFIMSFQGTSPTEQEKDDRI
jgi:hypothetical protein